MSSRLKWNERSVMAVLNAAGHKGVVEGAKIIAKESQDRVPVQTGELKRSQRRHTKGLQAVVAYMDSKAVGAHENLTAELRNEKQAKFLESAANDKREDVIAAIAEELRKALL